MLFNPELRVNLVLAKSSKDGKGEGGVYCNI